MTESRLTALARLLPRLRLEPPEAAADRDSDGEKRAVARPRRRLEVAVEDQREAARAGRRRGRAGATPRNIVVGRGDGDGDPAVRARPPIRRSGCGASRRWLAKRIDSSELPSKGTRKSLTPSFALTWTMSAGSPGRAGRRATPLAGRSLRGSASLDVDREEGPRVDVVERLAVGRRHEALRSDAPRFLEPADDAALGNRRHGDQRRLADAARQERHEVLAHEGGRRRGLFGGVEERPQLSVGRGDHEAPPSEDLVGNQNAAAGKLNGARRQVARHRDELIRNASRRRELEELGGAVHRADEEAAVGARVQAPRLSGHREEQLALLLRRARPRSPAAGRRR